MAKESKQNEAAVADAGIATEAENAKLKHVDGGRTTRDDGSDVGVPMLPGDPGERQGPEDALGEGPKRGDYSKRVHGEPTVVVPVEDAKEGEPQVRTVAQRPNASDRGDADGKGGVDTATS